MTTLIILPPVGCSWYVNTFQGLREGEHDEEMLCTGVCQVARSASGACQPDHETNLSQSVSQRTKLPQCAPRHDPLVVSSEPSYWMCSVCFLPQSPARSLVHSSLSQSKASNKGSLECSKDHTEESRTYRGGTCGVHLGQYISFGS